VQLINGKTELLNFGGNVMKNVAGYDVSRLQAGALGTLGVLSQISIKVLPIPEAVTSLAFELPAQEAIETMNARAGQPRPLAGAFWVDGTLHLRLAGAAAVEHTAKLWGGQRLWEDAPLWSALRDMALPLVDIGRRLMERQVPRPLHVRSTRHALRKILSNPRLFRLLLRLSQVFRPLLPALLKTKIPPRKPMPPLARCWTASVYA